jgi:hypothetical protein
LKRLVTLVALLALFTTACGPSYDRYRLRFEAAQQIATPTGPVTFTVAPSGRIYYAELRTNAFHYLDHNNAVHDLFTTRDKPDSLVVDAAGRVIVAARTRQHRLTVTAYNKDSNPEIVWHGPTTHSAAHLVITTKQELVIGVGDEVLELAPTHRVISRHWTDPVVVAGRGDRIWVADNEPPGGKERLARGRETDHAKRNRFASVLPPYTNPSGGTMINDEILLCSRTHKKVYRLHVGLDDVARRRNFVGRLMCDRDIASLPDGSVITAQTSVIYRYPPRT